MSIFHRRKKNNSKTGPPITAQELQDLPYAGDFDLPREEEKLRAAYEHERAGGNFDIRKVFSAKGTGAKTIAKIGHFPAYHEVTDMVEEQYGGGSYNIHPAGSARILKTYTVEGPSRFKPGGTRPEKSHVQELKAELEANLLIYAIERFEDDPELQRIAALGMLKKHLGVELPADVEIDWQEQLFRDGIEGNPEFKEALVIAELGKRGAEVPEEPDPMEETIKKYQQLGRLREALDSGKKPPSLMRELILALPEVLKFIQQVQGSDFTKSGAQAEPPLEAPVDSQEGRGSGLGHVSAEVVPPPAGLDFGPSETPKPPTPPVHEPRQGAHTPRKVPLSKLDWAELERGVHGDPGEFIGGVCLAASEQDSQYHHQLASLFRDKDPDVILAELSRLAESMAVAEGEDYEVAVSVVNHLRQTKAGRMWLDQAHVAAEVIPALIDQHSVGGVESAENEESDGSGLDGGEDFDGPLLV
ncbi:MAG: hypothetical protein O7A06_00205 [Acidobacteria bacterium]|nr:hypothetical protein [Acidobacteriota bacterium]